MIEGNDHLTVGKYLDRQVVPIKADSITFQINASAIQ